ncbi:HAD hydrolase, family IB [Candidatus Nasuia deltocephalinicola]|nr:HAD hydrolase, family IB [Candidatus Nasuia deltocephalinicola]
MSLILFDLDNTIINIDSDFEWILYLNKIKPKKKFFLKNIFFFKNYKKNKLNINKYNKFSLNKLNILNNNCKKIKTLLFFLKKIIKNKINNKTIFNLNIIKLIHKVIINTSTNKNIIKFLNFFHKIKLSKQSNNKKKYINKIIVLEKYKKGLLNYKSKKIKNILLNNFIYSDSSNDIIWIKKKIISTNPDEILLNNSISRKKYILIKKNIKKLFY